MAGQASERDNGSIDSLTRLVLEADGDPTAGKMKLKRAGDLALLLTGFFQENYQRKNAPSLRYHQSLGARAYHQLSRTTRGFSTEIAMCNIYAELGEHFDGFSEVLAEVAEISHITDENGLVHLYQRWLQENRPYQRRLLLANGMFPASDTVGQIN